MGFSRRFQELTGRWGAWALLACSLLSFTGIYLMIRQGPLFTDELHWQMQNARVPYDGWRMINLYPHCTAHFSWAVPWPLMPGRELAALFHAGTPEGIRLLGMGQYVAVIALLGYLLHVITRVSLPLAMASSFALMSVGVLPTVAIINRPEPGMFIGLCLALILAIEGRQAQTARGQAGCMIAFVVLLSWLLSLHPKLQWFLPFLGCAAWLMRAPSQHVRAAFLLAVAVMGLSCVWMWRMHSTCPEAPEVEDFLSDHTLLPHMLFDDTEYTLKQAVDNLNAAGERYFRALQLSPAYYGLYPRMEVAEVPKLWIVGVNLATMLVALLVCATLGLGLLVRPAAVTPPRTWRALPYLLVLPMLLVLLTKREAWSFWESAWLWPALWLACAMRMADLGWQDAQPRLLRGVMVAIIVASLASHAVFTRQWSDFYARVANPQNVMRNGFMPEHYAFQGVFDFPERAQRIQRVAQRCGIHDDQTAQHVMVDDWTYLPLRHTFQPFYARFLYEVKPTAQTLTELMQAQHSSGAVLLCKFAPQEWKSRMMQEDGICCIGAAQLEEMR